MTEAKDHQRLTKKLTRKGKNVFLKMLKAKARHQELIALGRSLVVTEKDGVKTYDLPPSPVEPPTPPRLSWLGGKMFPRSDDSVRGRSAHSPEHNEGVIENASRTFTIEVNKALMPEIFDVKSSVLPATVPAPDLGEVTQ